MKSDNKSLSNEISAAILGKLHGLNAKSAKKLVKAVDDCSKDIVKKFAKLQKDEAQAQNPPNGAAIDYYLKNAATGPVIITILNASGATVHEFASNATAAVRGRRGARGGGGIPNMSALWRVPAEPLSALAGIHRVVWSTAAVAEQNGDGQVSAPIPASVGTFTAKLTVNGTSYTQTFTVKPDPRVPAR